ncbi:GspH/FimT family pseudopilin [Pseudomonas sp. JDS28PS106]|uniref:GspH/FimT family pseudopilin n=1 Tax=Pseudomonas sp. JDS28PS106 TaxID=2497235 RepID=UPI002FCF3396
MRLNAKGFSLVELLVTVSIVAILAAVAIPNFNSTLQNNRAETEVSDLQRALNYARLEAINRGVSVRIAPTTGTDWTTELQVTLASSAQTVLRKVTPLSSGATLVAANVAAVEFNNLGGMTSPASAVAMTYTRGSTTKVINVCLTGRIMVGSSCS